MWMIIVVCALCLIYYLRKEIRPKDSPPPVPGKSPIIGHAYQAFRHGGKNIWNFLKDTTKFSIESGSSVSCYFGPLTYYVVTDIDDCMKIANTFLQKAPLYELAKMWLGNGLITSSVEKWKHHRKQLNTVFNQQVLDGFISIFNYQARHMCGELESEVDAPPFDIGNYFQRSSLETIYLTATGIDLSKEKKLNTKYTEAIESVLELMVDRFSKIWLHFDCIWNISREKKIIDKKIDFMQSVSNMEYIAVGNLTEIYSFNRFRVSVILKYPFLLHVRYIRYIHTSKYFTIPRLVFEMDLPVLTGLLLIIKKRKENDTLPDILRISGKNLRTFGDVLFKLEEEDGSKVFTDQCVKDHINTLIAAGYKAVGLSLLHTVLLVGSHPRVQNKIFEELQEVFGTSDRDVSKDDLTRLVYLEAVVKESVRLYPVVPLAARSIQQNIKLKKVTLYAGNSCVLSFYGVNRHPMWGPDANEFVPERWLDPSKLPSNPNYFATFGFGKRNCIGKTYTMMWMKILLSHTLRHYEVYGDHTKIVHMYNVVLKPVSGHFITIQRRK